MKQLFNNWLKRVPAELPLPAAATAAPIPPASPPATTPLALAPDPVTEFHAWEYLRHNQRRQEHLASLGLSLAGASVLEVGAGIGDHTSFFLDRGCRVTSSEGRPDNVAILAKRVPQLAVHLLDMEKPELEFSEPFDIVYCYGLLYHLRNPAVAIAYMAHGCRKMLLLETCVTFNDGASVNPVPELREVASQAVSGQGCRPNRRWVFDELKKHFPHVYMPVTQPWHEEFPADWTTPPAKPELLTRAVFVASRQPLDHPLLREEILLRQRRH